MSNYEIELQVQGSPSGELTQQVDGEPGGGSVSAREAEAWARGTRAGTAVSSDDPTYHNNSKYYAEQAHDAAESASAAYGTNLLAPTFDASQAYPAGQHVIHDGGYYVLPEGHTAGDTWAETSKTQQTVGGEVTGLKSAIGTVPEGKNLQGEVDELQTVKADKDGAYEDLTAGNALYLLSDRGDTDVAPYVFRKTGGAKNGYGREFLRKIVGGTVAWNQLVDNDFTNHYATTRASLTKSGNVYTLSNTDASGWSALTLNSANRISKGIYNHIVLAIIRGYDISNTGTTAFKLSFIRGTGNSVEYPIPSNGIMLNKITSGTFQSDTFAGIGIYAPAGGTSGDSISFTGIQLFDLTQMFGSTIADAIYAMEQATEGSGVALFRSLFPNNYYAYDAGSLQSVQAKEHRLTGKNQIDFGTQTINGASTVVDVDLLPGLYYISFDVSNTSVNISPQFRDDDNTKNIAQNGSVVLNGNRKVSNITTTQPIHKFRFYSDGNVTISNVQIERNNAVTAYEPFEEHVYPLDAGLVLRGIPKWDSTNGLYYDGDEYEADGTVTRRYGIVDMGTMTWTYESTSQRFRSNTLMSVIKKSASGRSKDGLMCAKYVATSIESSDVPDKQYFKFIDGSIYVYDYSYSDASDFTTANSGVYLVYELATPTTESADAFRELQISAHGGTEEFIDAGVTASTPTRDVSVPVGTETFYPVDIWHLIDELTALVLEN